LIGGVLAIKPETYGLINGFSNNYWAWGAEDDDLAMRMIAKEVCVKRPSRDHALYKMSRHRASKRNPKRERLLFTSIMRMSNDGLNNLVQLGIKIVDVQFYNLFTHIKIDVGKPDTIDY
jgi:hypothetical protein